VLGGGAAVATGDAVPPGILRPGQSATRLADGRWLLIGGEGPRGPSGEVVLYAPESGQTIRLAPTLGRPRADHTATVLPDGTVAIVGGRAADGALVSEVERLDLDAMTLEPAAVPGFTPRARHTATVLTDGQVLLVGGLGPDGRALATAERWDPVSQTVTLVAGQLDTPRAGHTATLLADGRVWLAGGEDASGSALAGGALYDPETDGISPAPGPPTALDTDPPAVVATMPADGAADVALDRPLGLRVAPPLAADGVAAGLAELRGPGGPVPVRVGLAEDGRLVFVTPDAPLEPGAAHTLTVRGWRDSAGQALADTIVTFTTRPVAGASAPAPPSPAPTGADGLLPAADESARADEVWQPDLTRGLDGWRSGLPPSPWTRLPPLAAPRGVTALAGQVLTLWGDPLPGVTLAIGPHQARTDATGRFLLTEVPAGHQELLIDGRSAGRPGRAYGVFEVGVVLAAGRTTALGYTVWMPVLDLAHAVTIPSPTPDEVVVTTPRIPGLEVRLPAGTVVRDHAWRIAHDVSITPIPLDRPPFPLPPDVNPPAYFTIQPGAGYVYGPNGGARIVYPNAWGYPAGSGHSFWHYDPGGQGWYVYGLGAVAADGRQIVPDPGASVYEFTGAMVGSAPPRKPKGPPLCALHDECAWDGDPVALATGQFVQTKTDIVLPGPLPIVLERTFVAGETVIRPFGMAATHNYAIFIAANPGFQDGDLNFPSGTRVRLVRTNPGSGSTDGIFTHTDTATPWHGLDLRFLSGRWVMTLRDGTVYEFDANWGLLQRIQDRFGNWLQITLGGGQANLSRIEASTGRWLAFTYHPSSNRIHQIQDNLGRTWTYAYDGSGRLQTVTDPEQGVTEYTYDAQHRMVTLKDARTIVFLTNEYDANGRVFRQTQADQTTYQFAYSLNGQGDVTQTDVTDPRAMVRRVTFDAAGRPVSQTRAVGRPEQQVRTYERQPGTDFLAATVDALSRRTEYTYDPKGNVTQVKQLAGTPNVVTTTLTYDPTYSQVTSVTDPLNHTTTFGYSPSGALTSVTDPLNHTTTITPHPTGQPAAIQTPLNHTTTFTYDAGDLVTITDPLGRTTQRFLDGAGRVVAATDPLGRTTHYEYDGLNRLKKVADPISGQTQFAYDPNGNLLTVTDARNNATTYAYNTMDRLQTRTDPLLRVESYVYDNNGNLSQVTDRKSQVTTFTYDGLNRRTVTQFHDAKTITATYDAGNRATQFVDTATGAGTITQGYDGLDRLTSQTTPKGTVSYTYDAASRRATMTVTGQPQVVYTYDNADRLTQLVRGSSTVSLTYWDDNRRRQLTLPNGIMVDYGYDAASQLTGLTYNFGAATLGTLTYGYDLAGNRQEVGGTWARTNLPAAITTTAYDAANRLTQWGTATLTYDFNGNLTNDGTKTYTWNVRDQLLSMTGASFQYDAQGRRHRRVVGSTTRDFVYDGLQLVQEKQNTQVKANLIAGLGLDEVFTRIEGSTTRHLLEDALGSTLALTDANGAVQTQYTYAPFGTTTSTGPTNTNPFKFTGREDDGTGLYYYRARYYHSGLQRFVSEDPIEFRGGDWSLYTYVRNNPIGYRDPLGLWYIDLNISAGFGLGVTGGVLFNNTGIYPYFGGGIVTPGGGGSLTWSPNDPGPGWNAGVQAQYGAAAQFGYGFGPKGGPFGEYGVGWPPGGAITGYYVWGPFGGGSGSGISSSRGSK
jgi:RHS repeat-associated protein